MHSGLKLILLLLLCAPPATMAQDISSPFHQAQGCDRENSSRLPARFDCGQFSRPTIIFRSPEQAPELISAAEVILMNCGAGVALEYEQRDAIARVEGQLENESCAASSGKYVIAIRTRNDAGELQTVEFTEAWQRDDNEPVAFSKDYEIGNNVDLVRVSAIRVSCRCTEPQP